MSRSTFSLCSFFIGNYVLADSAYVNINNRESVTRIRAVTIDFSAPEGTRQMLISNDSGLYGAEWEPYQESKTWYLEYGVGTHTVYVKFKDKAGSISQIYKDTIQLSPAKEMGVEFEINDGAKETISNVPMDAAVYPDDIIIINESFF